MKLPIEFDLCIFSDYRLADIVDPTDSGPISVIRSLAVSDVGEGIHFPRLLDQASLSHSLRTRVRSLCNAPLRISHSKLEPLLNGGVLDLTDILISTAQHREV